MKQLEFNFKENKEVKFMRTLILKSETFFRDDLITISKIDYGDINITVTWSGFYKKYRHNIDKRAINNFDDIKSLKYIYFILRSVRYFLET